MKVDVGRGSRVASRLTAESFGRGLFVIALIGTSLSGQPVAPSITTGPQPLAGQIVFDTARNLYYTGTNGPVTAGVAQTQNGGGTCTSGGGFVPTSGPCTDAYVAKVDGAGNIIFGTYLGGSTADKGTALVVDDRGNVFVTGTTGGSFPTTASAAIATSTTSKSFAAKLSADGSRILYSTYLPDTARIPSAIAIDAQGNAYIAGQSSTGHAYVSKLSADGSVFLYSAVLAGGNQDSANTVLADAAGNVIVAGRTSSPDFPVSPNAAQSRLAGAQNVFVAGLDTSGNLIFSTYLGGSGTDTPTALQTDSTGNIYVAGQTSSLDFPTTTRSFQPSPIVPLWNSASPAGFIFKLSVTGSALAYSSYVMSADQGLQQGVASLAVTASGDAYLSGITGAGFPVTPSAPQLCFQGPMDVFLAHLDPQDGALVDATYIGQNANAVWGLSLAGDGSILVVWHSSGNNVMSQIQFGGAGLNARACLSASVLNAASLSGSSAVEPGELITLTGFGIGPDIGLAYQPDVQGHAPLQVAGVQVLFDGQPAPVLYAQSRQVNALAPLELSGKTVTNITVAYQGVPVGSTTASVVFGVPGIFRLQPGLSSQAAALNQDGTINGPSNPAAPDSVVTLWGTGFGPTDPPCLTGGLNAPGPANLSAGLSALIFDGRYTPALYAGSAPTLLCGVVQINMVVPTDAKPGAYMFVPVSAMAVTGGQTTAAGNVAVSIAVKQ
jgi:uncharacterized protein (TIGR03437 family)